MSTATSKTAKRDNLPVVVTYAQPANRNLNNQFQFVVQVGGSRRFWVHAHTGFAPSIVLVKYVRPLPEGYEVCSNLFPETREVKQGSALRSEIEGLVTTVVRSLEAVHG